MRTLIGIAYSGWTEKARWALDHHGLAYVYREHTPLLGELALRRHAPRGAARATVPLLLEDESDAVMGSYAIARHADAHGRGPTLFPAEALAAIDRWELSSEQVLRVARSVVVARLRDDRAAQAASLPGFVPGVLRPALAPVARLGAGFIARKHLAPRDASAEITAVAVPALERLRDALQGRQYLLDGFSYADVTMAASLQFVRAVADRYLPLPPALRAVWTQPDLAARYGDLLAWRDEIYARHRVPAARD